ncbi:hypothetical protein CBR_g24212 [Chara braunii]|uniref:Reverse transcriptase domain-containing protein n=1 Tax=Chara braunii TaxID=69332 RepID=A0A388L653_CHABU|nr:hypothetical protein CBR_g24212 [Chara braunii]|eukprot:GBG77764.1 hypothetical protein CBR_g24212 [Chara braunii]
MEGEVFDQNGRVIDPEIPGVTREEALCMAALGPNAPGMFRIWQEREEPVVQVEDITNLEEKVNRMGIGENKGNVPLVEEETEEEDVRANVRDTFDRMEDLVDKMQRLHLRLQGICEEAGKEGAGCPKVFTMGRGGTGDGPNVPNPRMLRANMAARNSGSQRSMRGTIPFATRRPAGGNPQKEQAQASQPAEEEPPITVEGDEDEDGKIREEEERQAEIRAKRRKGEAKEGRSKGDTRPSKKRKYQTSIEEGVDLEGLVNKLLEGHNELLNLKEILASAPKLREMVKARLSRRRVASVRMGDLIPKEANGSVAGSKMDWKFVGTGSIDVMIKGKMHPGMVDTEAEMNIVNGETAVKLGLEVDENDRGFLNGASSKTGYTGVASNMVIEIERVKRMREDIQNGPCRIDDETEKELIIGEPGFLTRQEEDLVKELIREKHGAYAFNDDQRGRLDVDKIEMIRIHTVPHEPWNVRGSKYPNPEDRRRVVEYLDGKIRTDVAGYSSGPYASPWFCFVKPNGVLRWVQDLQRLNAVTVRDAGGLPNADKLSEACAGRSIVSLIDLYSGYDKFPVYPADRPITTMHTPRGLVHMNVAPQGWTNVVAMVLRSMIRVMQPISPQITERYIDDLAVKGPIEKDESEVAPVERMGDKERIANVRGARTYKRRIEGVVAGCTRWRVCKVRLWRDMREFPRDDVEDDLRFDGTNLEDFIESLQLATERGEWSEEEKRKQLIARSDKCEKEKIRGIVEGSRTWKRIMVELWMAYTQARQDQIKKERLQKKGLWIGREVTESQGKEEDNEEEDNVPLKKLKNKARVFHKSSSKESEQVEGDEQEEEEASEERKRSMGACMVPRKKKFGKKRAIESGRKEVQERVSEKGEEVEDEEGKEVKGGGKAPKVKRTKEKRPIGDKEETSGIGKKEDENDGQVEKLMRDMEEMRKKVRELNEEKEELQKEMSQLRVTLNVRSRELEEEVATRVQI